MSILDDYKTLSPEQVEKKMRTLDELSDDEEIVLPKYPHDDDDDADDDDDVNVTPQQVMTAAFETQVSKQLQYSLRKTDERTPPNMYTPATYNKEKEQMKVRSRKPNLYISMQNGGLPIFKGLPSHKIRGAGFLGSIIGKIGFKHMAKLAAKIILPKIGKHVKEKIAPEILGTALESGTSVLSGKQI